GDSTAVVAGEPFPEARCAANRAAGTITYLSSFDFAASASIVEVLVAEQRGYFDELCLDVEIQASFSTANYPLVAANDAQFSSGGSFSEIVTFAAANEADFVAVAVDGRTAIDALIVKPGEAATLDDMRGATIGVKGKLPSAVTAMLAAAGLVEGTDFETVPLQGFDPTAHIAIPSIVGFPGWKSNEPGILERAGIDFTLFDPTAEGVPGTFGVIYTNRTFITEHPSAAQDFVRAAMAGLADAIADPAAASAIAIELINGNGNPNFLSPEGEAFRWETESQLIVDTTPDGTMVGVPDPAVLQEELDTYAEVGLFGDGETPQAEDWIDASLISAVYHDDGSIIYPGQ
ncbi:MAG TPA: ABC transporter substrate-binding protein, partial [Ilumatobacteraceae bacterium]|nr:ABC transporter substrate-binding protein [Ilumatobacteraceae bacterium]